MLPILLAQLGRRSPLHQMANRTEAMWRVWCSDLSLTFTTLSPNGPILRSRAVLGERHRRGASRYG